MAYTSAIERSSGTHPDYFRNRSWALRNLGRHEEAARDAERARRMTRAAPPSAAGP